MKHIVKNGEPHDFINWKNQEKDRLEFCYQKSEGAADCAWRHLSSNEPELPEEDIVYFSKKSLKDSLLDEQGFICAFCMAGLRNDHLCTIDHFRPKKNDPRNNTFDYQNLLGCCSGIPDVVSKLNYKEDLRHCNNKKDDHPISISPLDLSCQQRFGFSLEGEIFPIIETDIEAIDTIQKLGLDSKILERRRKEVIQNYLYPDLPFEGHIKSNRLITKEEALNKIQELTQKKNGEFVPFVTAVIKILENIAN